MNPPPAALFLAAAGAQRLLTRRSSPSAASRTAAAVLGSAATVVLVAPVVQFARQRTTVDPRASAVPSELVVTGANAHTRNPMYVAMAGLLAAQAVVRPHLGSLLPLVGFAVWIDRRQIPAEEHVLRERFGEEFEAYRERVPRWLGPRTRRPPSSPRPPTP